MCVSNTIKGSHKTLSAKRKSRFKTNAIKNEVMLSGRAIGTYMRRMWGVDGALDFWEDELVFQGLPKSQTKFTVSNCTKISKVVE